MITLLKTRLLISIRQNFSSHPAVSGRGVGSHPAVSGKHNVHYIDLCGVLFPAPQPEIPKAMLP